MTIITKSLSIIWIYRVFRFFIFIITMYLFFSPIIDICLFTSIKFIEYPNLYCFKEDHLFKYMDEQLNKSFDKYNYMIKNIDINKIDKYIFEYACLELKDNKIYVSEPQYFKINFTDEYDCLIKEDILLILISQ